MSELTLDDAIKHCLEVAEQNDTQAEKWQKEGGEQWGKTTVCRECAADHRQLAEWLTELKKVREENKVLTSECDRLIKGKGELLKKSERIAEHKRLLKAAVEDFSYCSGIYGLCYYNIGCGVCADCNNTPCDDFQWRYADEALKLIES